MDFAYQKQHWDAFAHIDPRWSVLSHPDKHDGGWETDEFYATGDEYVSDVLTSIADLLPWWVDVYAGGRLLDLGCGPGRCTHALAEHFDEVVGYDVSPRMLELAREGAADNETFVENTTDDLSPFEDESFDFVFSNRVLQHVDRSRFNHYLAESVRVLKSDGVFWFQCVSHETGFTGPNESGPLPHWQHRGVRPFYEVNPHRVQDVLNWLLLTLPVAVLQVRSELPTRETSHFSYQYIVQKL